MDGYQVDDSSSKWKDHNLWSMRQKASESEWQAVNGPSEMTQIAQKSKLPDQLKIFEIFLKYSLNSNPFSLNIYALRSFTRIVQDENDSSTA